MAQEEINSNSELQSIKTPISVPLIYANGVSVGLTLTDLHLSAQVNGKPACLLAIPFGTAKSLMKALELAIKDYETRTGQTVLDLDELSKKLP